MGLYHHSHQCVNQEWVPRSTCPSLPAFLSTCVLFHLSASFPVSLSVYLCVLLYIFPPIYRATLFIYTFFLFVFYSVCLGVSLSFAVHLSVSGYSFPFFVHRAALLFVCLPVYILLSHCASVCLSQPFFCPSFSTYECVYLFFLQSPSVVSLVVSPYLHARLPVHFLVVLVKELGRTRINGFKLDKCKFSKDRQESIHQQSGGCVEQAWQSCCVCQ